MTYLERTFVFDRVIRSGHLLDRTIYELFIMSRLPTVGSGLRVFK